MSSDFMLNKYKGNHGQALDDLFAQNKDKEKS
jgi:hypothetical protein